MQSYFIIRGQKFWQDKFITELQGKYLAVNLKLNEKGAPDENGKLQETMLQLGVRPIQLYEIAYPKEHHDMIMNTMLKGNLPMRKEYGKWDKYLGFLRKIIGLKPIDPNYKKDKIMIVDCQHIDIIGIGTKEDKEFQWGEGI